VVTASTPDFIADGKTDSKTDGKTNCKTNNRSAIGETDSSAFCSDNEVAYSISVCETYGASVFTHSKADHNAFS